MSEGIARALAELWAGVGGEPEALDSVDVAGADPVLPSPFAVGTAAAATVAATCLAAATLWRLRGGPADPRVRASARASAVAFRSERYLRVDGVEPSASEPLTGDYRARDGWVRLHCNYPNHRGAVLRALGLSETSGTDMVAAAVSGRGAVEFEDAVHAAGGAAAALRTPTQWAEHPQSAAVASLPLVAIDRLADASPRGLTRGQRPLGSVRVLDVTRVIAGPVAGRTLASHGADVLRVGADHLPLVAPLVIDTGFGKRFCHIDLRAEQGRATLRSLVAEADVVLQAYRPGALARIGLGPADCAAIRPGLVYIDISAWGQDGPWRERRGFDSLVQMACGNAHQGRLAAGDPDGRPRPLPAQVLDHSTGFLAAFGAIEALRRQQQLGGSWHVAVSLARTARWLDGLGRVPDGLSTPDPGVDDVADLLDEAQTPFGLVSHVRAPGTIDGADPRWDTPPHRPRADPPTWLTLPTPSA